MSGAALEQLARELHAMLSGAVDVPVYEREAPRDGSGALTVEPPFVVYSADPRAPEDEGGEWTLDLFIDVWALGGFGDCYLIAANLDDILDGTAYRFESGTMCADRNGVVFGRMERDPDDERIRRMQSQYLLRFNADHFRE